MTVDVFKNLINEDKEALLIDIREVDEIKNQPSTLPAQEIQMGALFTKAVTENLPKDKLMILFCRSGFRAGIAARELKALGYTVEPLEGGLIALEESTYETS
jgi:rhodanese-related sulfurtransferase